MADWCEGELYLVSTKVVLGKGVEAPKTLIVSVFFLIFPSSIFFIRHSGIRFSMVSFGGTFYMSH